MFITVVILASRYAIIVMDCASKSTAEHNLVIYNGVVSAMFDKKFKRQIILHYILLLSLSSWMLGFLPYSTKCDKTGRTTVSDPNSH